MVDFVLAALKLWDHVIGELGRYSIVSSDITHINLYSLYFKLDRFITYDYIQHN
jgi:hypothetical protein